MKNYNVERVFEYTAAHGGGTFLRAVPINYSNGYVVATENFGVVPTNDPVIRSYITYCLDNYPLFGTWVDKGKVYFDKVQRFADKDEALEFAKSLGKIAIWDCKNGEAINV